MPARASIRIEASALPPAPVFGTPGVPVPSPVPPVFELLEITVTVPDVGSATPSVFVPVVAVMSEDEAVAAT